jgi:hypothetical protein
MTLLDNKLLIVPDNQKKWFRTYHKALKYKFEKSEMLCYDMFENNLFGINDRFLGWNHDSIGIVDSFVENYCIEERETLVILFWLTMIFEDFENLEFYELAHNLSLLFNSFEKAILDYKNEIENFYKANIDSELPF